MTPTIRSIQLATCARYGITLEEMLSPTRERRVAWPRQEAMALAIRFTKCSLPVIGRSFGRDHTTVLHGGAVAERRGIDPGLVERIGHDCG